MYLGYEKIVQNKFKFQEEKIIINFFKNTLLIFMNFFRKDGKWGEKEHELIENEKENPILFSLEDVMI